MDVPDLNVISSLSFDWVIVCAIAVVAAFDSLRSGTSRACAASLAVPIALFIYSALPVAVFLSTALDTFSTPVMQAVLFGVVYVISYLLAGRILGTGGRSSQPLSALLSGLTFAVLFTIMWISVPALSAIWQIGDAIQSIFGEAYRFWWASGAFLALAYARS